jgi:hypothetical protein
MLRFVEKHLVVVDVGCGMGIRCIFPGFIFWHGHRHLCGHTMSSFVSPKLSA